MFQGTTSSNSSKSSIGSNMRGEQLFVSVIYDFEYISEDGKRVFMKENEILLLINKTNHDWWQVIRRGDRRPFYAPAKYVAEFRPQAGEQRRELKLKSGGREGNQPWHINSNKNFRPMFSTFTGKGPTQTGPPGTEGLSYAANKRHSYAPPPGGRFSDRYRSNSLDSILVADLDRVVPQGPIQPVRHSYHVSTGPVPGTTYHIYPSEQHLMPKSQITLIRGGVGLSKRPTIEGLDKRKSWSLDISASANSRNNTSSLKSTPDNALTASVKSSGSTSSRLSSYQNTEGLLGIGSKDKNIQGSPDTRNLKKKPVPLPRSKVPVAEQQPKATVKNHTEKLFQRARTDLGSDALAFYKAKKMSQGSTGVKYPAPKVPTFHKPVPQKRTVPSLTSSHATLCDIPSQSATSLVSMNSKGPRPAVKDKPSFSTFKTSHIGPSLKVKTDDAKVNTKTKSATKEKRISRASSEGDILGQIQEVKKPSDASLCEEKPVIPKITRCGLETFQNRRLSNSSQQEILDNKSIPSISQSAYEDNTQRTHRSEPLTITSLPLVDKTSNDNVVEWMDKSCSSSYASNESSSILLSATAERSTDVSMEDQDLFSLESCTPGESGQTDRLLMSPCSTTSRSPPSPLLGMTPKRQVSEDWEEYEDTPSGRKFYFNTCTKEKSWKPPRKSKGSEAEYSAPTSPCPGGSSIVGDVMTDNNTDSIDDKEELNPETTENQVPGGYERKTNVDNGSPYFVNMFTGVRWFSAETTAGKTYYYEENGNESCWVLPNVSQTIQDVPDTKVSTTDSATTKNLTEITRVSSLPDYIKTGEDEPENENLSEESVAIRAPRKHSNVRPLTALPTSNRARPEISRLHLPISTPNIQIGEINIIVLKQGPLNKTKLVENGKKHRKNWTVSHAVLTDLFLLFFKDAKTFGQMQSGSNQPKPEQCVDLNGATVAWCTSDKSKRSNVFEVSAHLLGMTVLLQDDDLAVAAEWCREIGDVADRLTKRSSDSLDPNGRKKFSADANLQPSSTLQLPVRKVNTTGGQRVNRTKSLKMKLLGSSDELVQSTPSTPTAPIAANLPSHTQQQQSKVNIREKLRKFFMRRPAMDDLFRRGIMKNEPVFGSTLRELQVTDLSDVPLFVKKCIAEIEKGDLLKTDGVYRQSGNLSHIQRIRLQVDQGNLSILETVDDVHVLTGALKLFFRELKEPLILWEIVDKLLLACNHQSKKVKLKQMKDCIMSLPQPHKATLAFLLRHLVKVTSFKETNRMQIPTMAIVFGPTLMWPPSNLVTHNLALSMLQQNIIVEALLNNLDTIFSP